MPLSSAADDTPALSLAISVRIYLSYDFLLPLDLGQVGLIEYEVNGPQRIHFEEVVLILNILDEAGSDYIDRRLILQLLDYLIHHSA